jgi:hypothetical protein
MTKTAMIVTASVILLAIYDLYAVVTGGTNSSISRFMQDAGFDAPAIVFTCGFIAGHIFGYMPPQCKVPDQDSSP